MIYVTDKLRAGTVEGIIADADQIEYIDNDNNTTSVKDLIDGITAKLGLIKHMFLLVSFYESNAGAYEIGDSITPHMVLDIIRNNENVQSSTTVTVNPSEDMEVTTASDRKVVTYTGEPLTSGTHAYQITATQGGQTVNAPNQVFDFMNYLYYGEVLSKPASASAVAALCENGTLNKQLSRATTKESTNLGENKYYVFAVKGRFELVCRHTGTDAIVTECTTGTVKIQRTNESGSDTYSYIIVEKSQSAWNFKITSSQIYQYLTQWKVSGNSTVHTDEYLTQWKVEGNSVVDNNAILSCGDLGQDGKYHVKISNGVTIYDIPLTEPLRKVGDVADTIEFVNGVATVTRYFQEMLISASQITTINQTINCYGIANFTGVKNDSLCMCVDYTMSNAALQDMPDMSVRVTYMFQSTTTFRAVWRNNSCENVSQFKELIDGCQFIYELATPTTEVIQVSPFPISATDTYTSANDTPYSAFKHKNVEIWSCGEYSEVDNKWHIRILPEGYGAVDIALDEPLRKVGDVADSIEFADGVATVTRNIAKAKWNDLVVTYEISGTMQYARFYTSSLKDVLFVPNSATERTNSCLSADFIQNTDPISRADAVDKCMCTYKYSANEAYIYIRDTSTTSVEDFYEKYGTHEFYYRLATPTTETIQVPQIVETDSYSCIISQGGNAVEWSSFITE